MVEIFSYKCALLVALVVLSSLQVCNGGRPMECPPKVRRRGNALFAYKNRCYEYIRIEKSWPDARSDCHKYGGRLVTIRDSGTMEFIISKIHFLQWSNNGIWNGGHDGKDEGNWQWSTEDSGTMEDMSWAYWASGHPARTTTGVLLAPLRDCLSMRRPDWRWYETFCDNILFTYRYICQYDGPNIAAGQLGLSETDALSTGSIIGIVIGSLLILIIIILVIVAFLARRRKKAKREAERNGQIQNPMYDVNTHPFTDDPNPRNANTNPDGRVVLNLSANRAQYETPRNGEGVNLNDLDLDTDIQLQKKAAAALALNVRLEDDGEEEDEIFQLKKQNMLNEQRAGTCAMRSNNADPLGRVPTEEGATGRSVDTDLEDPSLHKAGTSGIGPLVDNSGTNQNETPTRALRDNGTVDLSLFDPPSKNAPDSSLTTPMQLFDSAPDDESANTGYEDPSKYGATSNLLVPVNDMDDHGYATPQDIEEVKISNIPMDDNEEKGAGVYDTPKPMNPYEEIPMPEDNRESHMYETVEDMQNSLKERNKGRTGEVTKK